MRRSVVIVGAGQIGYVTAKAFAKAGWHTQVLARTAPEWVVPGAVFVPFDGAGTRVPKADIAPANSQTRFPQLAAYPSPLFDYEVEDRFLQA